MELIQFLVYASLCTCLIMTILLCKHRINMLKKEHEDELIELKADHEDELSEMEASCQERELYEQNKFKQLNDAFEQMQIKYEIERSRNRKLRPGFDVEKVAAAIDKVKGVRVS